ncbi:MAG: DinB family protein [Gemmatimonadota bacterium]|nr:DinB family protein [Gemmatimonadota bacterium]
MPAALTPPDASEHAPYYAKYIDLAIAAVAGANVGDLRMLLTQQTGELESLLDGVDDEHANRAYAAGKWTLKESIVHLSDSERVFGYRALRIARGDTTPLRGFEQDYWVPESRANVRSLAVILAEFRAVRGATLTLVDSFDATSLAQVGVASGQTVSTRALCWIIAGHAAHHIAITRDRYLTALR